MNKKKINKINVILDVLWILIAFVLINLPNIMGSKFSINLGRIFVFIYILSIFIITYTINSFIKKKLNNK